MCCHYFTVTGSRTVGVLSSPDRLAYSISTAAGFPVPASLKQKTDNDIYYFYRYCPVICASRQRLLTPMKFIMCLMVPEVKVM
jgi:hypothetical protein